MKKFLGASLLWTTAMLAATGALMVPQDARANNDVCTLVDRATFSFDVTTIATEQAGQDPSNLACGLNAKANAGSTTATDATAVGANTTAGRVARL